MFTFTERARAHTALSGALKTDHPATFEERQRAAAVECFSRYGGTPEHGIILIVAEAAMDFAAGRAIEADVRQLARACNLSVDESSMALALTGARQTGLWAWSTAHEGGSAEAITFPEDLLAKYFEGNF